jgi:sporulation protein YlmC with PRC-barrel domain
MMRKQWHERWLRVLVVGAVLLWLSTVGCFPAQATPTPTPASPPDELFTESLQHYQVVDSEGKVIGPVDGLVVGRTSAVTSYVVVRLKDIYAFGKGIAGPQDRFLLIPWSHVRLDVAHQQLVVNADAVALTAAPSYFDLPNASTPTWDTEIRDFWAAQ